MVIILNVQWGESPLWSASFHGHQKCIELLLEAGANFDESQKVSVTSCMHLKYLPPVE